jgi:hypothetical protein
MKQSGITLIIIFLRVVRYLIFICITMTLYGLLVDGAGFAPWTRATERAAIVFGGLIFLSYVLPLMLRKRWAQETSLAIRQADTPVGNVFKWSLWAFALAVAMLMLWISFM